MLNIVLIGKLTSHASAKKPAIGAPYTDLTVMTITPTEAGFNKPLVETHAIRAYNLLGDDVAGLDKGDMIHIEGTIESWQRQEIREANADLPRHMVHVDGYRVDRGTHQSYPIRRRHTLSLHADHPSTCPQLQPHGNTPSAPRSHFESRSRHRQALDGNEKCQGHLFGNRYRSPQGFRRKSKNLRRGSYRLLSPEGILIDKAEAVSMAAAC